MRNNRDLLLEDDMTILVVKLCKELKVTGAAPTSTALALPMKIPVEWSWAKGPDGCSKKIDAEHEQCTTEANAESANSSNLEDIALKD